MNISKYLNQDQVVGVLRIVIPVALTAVVSRGYISPEVAADVTTLIVTAFAVVWSYLSHQEPTVIIKTQEETTNGLSSNTTNSSEVRTSN